MPPDMLADGLVFGAVVWLVGALAVLIYMRSDYTSATRSFAVLWWLALLALVSVMIVPAGTWLPFVVPRRRGYLSWPTTAFLLAFFVQHVLASMLVAEDARARGRPPFPAAAMAFFGGLVGQFAWATFRPAIEPGIDPTDLLPRRRVPPGEEALEMDANPPDTSATARESVE
jgi:hypothetical protein